MNVARQRLCACVAALCGLPSGGVAFHSDPLAPRWDFGRQATTLPLSRGPHPFASFRTGQSAVRNRPAPPRWSEAVGSSLTRLNSRIRRRRKPANALFLVPPYAPRFAPLNSRTVERPNALRPFPLNHRTLELSNTRTPEQSIDSQETAESPLTCGKLSAQPGSAKGSLPRRPPFAAGTRLPRG